MFTLAFSDGPVKNTRVVPRQFGSWPEVVSALCSPTVGQKDGAYFVRGPSETEERTNEAIHYSYVMILDGDSSFDPATGEVLSGQNDPGAPDPESVSAALREIGLSHLIYSTHSHAPPHKNKYRVVIPARMRQRDLDDCVAYVIDQLHNRGVYIAPVKENCAWSQAWFLPRLRDESAPFFSTAWNDGHQLDVPTARAWVEESRRVERAMQAPIAKTPISNRREGSVIEEFNRSATPEWMTAYLQGLGYTYAYKRGETHRFIRPNSETGTAGVIMFRGKRGDWCLYSHHSGADPLSHKVTDAFGIFATFSHGGDIKAAVRDLSAQNDEKPRLSPVELERVVEQITADEEPEPPVAPKPAPLEPKAKEPRIRLVRADELRRVQVPWLVNKLIPANGLAVMYGKPGTYKSFVAIYLSAHVAAGLPTLSGRTTQQGDVVYIAAEGRGGLHQRWAALRSRYEIPNETPLYFVEASLDLRESNQDFLDLVAAIQQRSAVPRLIVIDTLARTFGGGDENDASEMSQFIGTIGALQDQFGCAVMAIHHSGKDESRGMRGSSALLGAADVVLFLSRDMEAEGGNIFVQKMKDGEDGISEQFSATPWTDPDDPEVTSLIIEPGAPEKPQITGSNSKQNVFEALRREIASNGKLVEDPSVAGWDVYGISVSEWQDAYCAEEAADGVKDGSAKRKFHRAKSELIKENAVKVYNKTVWINGQSGR